MRAWREQAKREGDAAKKAVKEADILELPVDKQDGKIAELATILGEDAAALSAEFADYRETETEAEVTTAEVLEELIVRINTHIVAKPRRRSALPKITVSRSRRRSNT